MATQEIIKDSGGRKIRSVCYDEAETWYFSIVDVVAVLTESKNPLAYWRKLKQRLKAEGNETVTSCHALKMRAASGKMRMTDVATAEQKFRVIQSIPSPKADAPSTCAKNAQFSFCCMISKLCILAILSFTAMAGLAGGKRNSNLKFGVGRKSVFNMPNGDKAFVTGITGLKFSDFSIRESDKMPTFEDLRIVDAEKSSRTHLDDYWCEQMTDCNLLVWTGWAKWTMGITNEDDFAELLLKNPAICKHGIIGWTFANRGYAINESTDKMIAWVHANKPEKIPAVVRRVSHYISEADRWAYMQVDWQNRGGGHAVTCCGYAVKKGMNKDPLKPESLAGLFIVNSDNDKKNGAGGRTAPNTIQFQRAWFDKDKQAFFSEFPNGDLGKIRFFCFMRAFDKKLTKFLKRTDNRNDNKGR